ncbi:uncharacterized protein RAG0_03012 [Rhynchosporium agropyri]|uniref:Ubiquitin-like protease family profile domain-containing protein n=1 Tax=Rhynchosporium agropyri TaxID=914238 RepID=A0A1E1K2X7_9HELO|nr:uncharacterized protein RAG0_03012 [Rhynchosporium agropyri]
MNDSMLDCLAFYVTEMFPYIAKIIGALHGLVRNFIDNVPLPLWQEFEALLNKVKGLQLLKESQTSKPDNTSTGSWGGEIENTNNRSCLDVTSRDLRTPLHQESLSDVVVNNTLALLAGESSGIIYTWDSLLSTNIVGGKDVSQWTIKAGMNGIFDYHFHLFPINLTTHWMLAKVDLLQREITTYDPLSRDVGHEQSIYTNLEKWVSDNDMIDAVPRSPFQYISCKEVPDQRNGYDGIVIVLMVAYRLMRNLTVDGAEEVNWCQEQELIARLLRQVEVCK